MGTTAVAAGGGTFGVGAVLVEGAPAPFFADVGGTEPLFPGTTVATTVDAIAVAGLPDALPPVAPVNVMAGER